MAPPFAFDVSVLGITVAALMTTPWIARALEVPAETDLVLIPGLCEGDPQIVDVVLTTEEEGVGLVAGAALGGQRAALLMQSSGVGNCINMFSLLRNCGFGCIVLVTMRGEFGEFNPWQVPMGSITEEVLRLSGFLTYRIETAEDVDEIVGAGCEWRSTAVCKSPCFCRSG